MDIKELRRKHRRVCDGMRTDRYMLSYTQLLSEVCILESTVLSGAVDKPEQFLAALRTILMMDDAQWHLQVAEESRVRREQAKERRKLREAVK